MTDDLTRYVVFTIHRTEDDVEALTPTCLHSERTRSRRGASDLAASYLMTLMAGRDGATVREVGQRPVMWTARFADEPSRDELIVILRHDQEVGMDPIELWTEATANR